MQFRKLVTPVIIVLCVSILVFGLSAAFFADRQDRGAALMERRIFEAILTEQVNSMTALAQDNAWWDKAVEKIYLEEDIEWLEEAYGGSDYGIAEISVTLVVRPDMTVIFEGIYNGQPLTAVDFLTPDVRRLVASLTPSTLNTAISDGGLVLVKGKLFALGVSMVQPGNLTFDDPLLSYAPKPVMIFAREVKSTYLGRRMAVTGVSDITFSPTIAGSYQYEIIGVSGDAIGYYDWQPDKPGSRLLAQMIWPAVFFVAVLLAAVARFLVQARRAIEAAENADNSKSMFLASMSHEVRTPLNAILGFSEMIALELFGKVEGAKNQEYLKIIRHSGEHLLTVINDILDISKLEAGRFDVHAETLRPESIIQDCVGMVQGLADDKSISLVQDVEPVFFRADARIMRQSIINILSNAIKYSPDGSRVFVSGQTVHGFYVITIADNGKGMEPHELELALKPFGRVSGDQIEVVEQVGQKGTGLGLPLVERFMNLVGGSMKLRSVPNHGTSVSLSFPLND